MLRPSVRKARGDVREKCLVIRAVRAVDEEGVRLPPADNAARIRHQIPDSPAHIAQNAVSVSRAETLVEHAEMVDIQHDGVHLHLPVMLVELLRVAVKELPVIQPRQRIALRGADDLPVLGQFDGPPYAGQDDG